MYESLGIDHRTKSIIYSDSVNLVKALGLVKQCSEIGFKGTSKKHTTYGIDLNAECLVSFGIGTFLTNDFTKASSGGKERSKALNMVIKLANVDGKYCIKISDEIMKVNKRMVKNGFI